MDLLLWRHAEALPGLPDSRRELSRHGRKQAVHVAAWLRRHHPKHLRILVSPSLRTLQTAQAFTENFTPLASLGPAATVEDILVAAGWPDAATPCLIVSHQPVLGCVAARLLTGVKIGWTVKKGALWWLTRRERDGEAQTLLRTVIHPDMI